MKPAGQPLNFPIKKTHPNAVNRPVPATHHKKPAAAEHANKLYRVRDRDWVKVWGESLTHAKAVELHAKVVGGGKSRTARIEEQNASTVRPSDEQLAEMRAKHAEEDKRKTKRGR